MFRISIAASAIAGLLLWTGNALAGFPTEAALAPELCTGLVLTSDCEQNPNIECSGWESEDKRMEFFIDDEDYLESQWPLYYVQLRRLGRAEGVMRYRGELMHNAYMSQFTTEGEFKTAFAQSHGDGNPWSEGELYDDDPRPLVYYSDTKEGKRFCSGILIGPNHYLTPPT